jgi:hypothetical protein
LRWFWDLDLEFGLGTHIATVQLFMIATAALVIAWRLPLAQRWHRLYWLMLAAAFAFLGVDEYFQIHEWLVGPSRWRWLYSLGGGLLGILTLWIYRRVYPKAHTFFVMLFDGLLIMALSGIWVEHAIFQSFCYDTADSLVAVCERFDNYLIFEELFELIGAGIVLLAFLYMAQTTLPPAAWKLQKRALILTGAVSLSVLVGYLWLLPALEVRILAQPLAVDYLDGKLSLQGYRLDTEQIAPGDTLNITLYWRASQPLESDLHFSLHALAKPEHRDSFAQADELLLGQYPSKAFLPGVPVRKIVTLSFPTSTPQPGAYALMLRVWRGNYERGELNGIDISASDRPLLTPDSLLLGNVTVLPDDSNDSLVSTESYQFAAGPALVAHQVPDHTPAKGSLALVFQWQTGPHLDQDLTQFVHLIGEASGEFVFGYDQPPFAGKLPTSTWPSGVELQDHWEIALPEDLKPGRYAVYTGLYDPLTIERIAVTDAQHQPVMNNSIYLGTIQIQP